jgi:Ca2+-binding EF-hand superfamily protein
LYSDVHSPLVATLLQFNEKATGHDQFQISDHTIDGRVKKWDIKKCLTFQDNVDKENLNGLYNELTNSITENITNATPI